MPPSRRHESVSRIQTLRPAQFEIAVPAQEVGAFEALFRENYVTIVRTAFRVVGCKQEAEEIAAETFAKLFREEKTVRNPVGWLKHCAVRGALDALRSATRRRIREAALPHFPAPGDSPETALRLTEQRFQVRRVLAELPLRDAELLLARAEDHSYQEIAEQLQILPASVGTLLARAEAKFRKRYEARYGKE